MHITYIVYTKKGRKIMGLGFSLEDLFDMSQVEEGDEPVFFSKTGNLNLSASNVLHRGKAYKYGDTGVAYSDDGKTLLSCPAMRPGTVRIHEGVDTIGDYAFYKGALSAVVLPDSLTRIERSAFAESDLTQITFGKGLTSIGDDNDTERVFSNCKCLASVVIPDNITALDNYSFSECSNLTKAVLPTTMTKIGSGVFSGCILENTVIPKSVKTVGGRAFVGARSLIFEDIPKKLIAAIASPEDDSQCDFIFINEGEKNYTKVTYNNIALFIPKFIKSKFFKELVDDFDKTWFSSPKGHTLFLEGSSLNIQTDTAFAEYQSRQTPEAFSFMNKNGKAMAERYLLKKRQDEFVDLLKTGAIDRKLLPELLDIANKNEKTIATAYIMQCMGNAPDDVYDDTYDL